MPQLASGEMAWAIDTQELYIGNGAVSEGAPAVGNTKILTEKDNILELFGQYVYKPADSTIQTGVDPSEPILRSLQDRLDDHVTSANYGILPDIEEDQTLKIQHMIDNLFRNQSNLGTTKSRITLTFLPGTYKISDTIHLPAYVNIVGAGVRKTVFDYTGSSGIVFDFVKDFDPANPNASITSNTQPRFCDLRGFTVNTNDPDITCFQLDSVRDSKFEDIEVTGSYSDSTAFNTSIGFKLNAYSAVVTTQRNKFNRIRFQGFTYGVFSNTDIFANHFNECEIRNCHYGVDFGDGTRINNFPVISGEQFGPRRNIIAHSLFDNINTYGIRVVNGYGNRSRSNTFVNVGNDGSELNIGTYNIIKFVSQGNTSIHDMFDRAIKLVSNDQGTEIIIDDTIENVGLSTGNWENAYIREVDGTVTYQNLETQKIQINGSIFSEIDAFRIPISNAVGVIVNYIYTSTEDNQLRHGQLHLAIDKINNLVQVTDDFNFTGGNLGANPKDTAMTFYARIVDESVIISYKNNNLTDDASLTYSYTVIS